MNLSQLFLIVLTCVVLSFNVHGQTKAKYIGIEAGVDGIICNDFEKDYIRGYEANVDGIYVIDKIKSRMHSVYVGVKVEQYLLNDKLGFLAGIRFLQLNSAIEKSEKPNFFYVLTQQNGTTTEYLRVKEIDQASTYTGIPIELRYFPFGAHKFSIFFKLGAEFNFLFKTKTAVTFFDSALGIYSSEVLRKTGDPNSFYSNLYGGAGIRLGNSSKTRISIEARIPSILITSNASSLTNGNFGGGLQLNVQVPF